MFGHCEIVSFEKQATKWNKFSLVIAAIYPCVCVCVCACPCVCLFSIIILFFASDIFISSLNERYRFIFVFVLSLSLSLGKFGSLATFNWISVHCDSQTVHRSESFNKVVSLIVTEWTSTVTTSEYYCCYSKTPTKVKLCMADRMYPFCLYE